MSQYVIQVSGSVSSSIDITSVITGSIVKSYAVPGRIDEHHPTLAWKHDYTSSLGLNAVKSGSFTTSEVV